MAKVKTEKKPITSPLDMKPKICGGNIKLGNMGSWSTLYSDQMFYIDKFNMDIQGTCGKHCTGCKEECYVKHSYRYGSVMVRHGVNTYWLTHNLRETFKTLDKQLTRMRKKFNYVRINQSGELTSEAEFREWCWLASKHPESKFYVYTKATEYVEPALKEDSIVPANLTILVSIWHEYGIAEYVRLSKYPQIKCFVYDDGYDYTEKGINIQTYCKAYKETKGKNGKVKVVLDHDVTCEKCQKCIKLSDNTKIVGCKAH